MSKQPVRLCRLAQCDKLTAPLTPYWNRPGSLLSMFRIPTRQKFSFNAYKYSMRTFTKLIRQCFLSNSKNFGRARFIVARLYFLWYKRNFLPFCVFNEQFLIFVKLCETRLRPFHFKNFKSEMFKSRYFTLLPRQISFPKMIPLAKSRYLPFHISNSLRLKNGNFLLFWSF